MEFYILLDEQYIEGKIKSSHLPRIGETIVLNQTDTGSSKYRVVGIQHIYDEEKAYSLVNNYTITIYVHVELINDF